MNRVPVVPLEDVRLSSLTDYCKATYFISLTRVGNPKDKLQCFFSNTTAETKNKTK